MKKGKKNGSYCNNNLKNAEVYKIHFTRLYNNHNEPNEIQEQAKDTLVGEKQKEK